MSAKKLDEIEDYLVERIAALDGIVSDHAGGDKASLQGWRAMLTEAKVTLRKVREIRKGKAG